MKLNNFLIVGLGIFFLVANLSKTFFLEKTVFGDGIYYYSWMRSIVVDYDVSFSNEYRVLDGIQPETPTGKTGNVYPIGPPILWSPFYIFMHQLIRSDGFSFIYQLIISLVSSLYCVSGLILLYRLLSKYYQESTAVLTVFGIGLGTNLFFYGALDTVNSHSVSFFISTLLLTLIFEKRSLVAIGLCTGVLALIRTQDILFLLLSLFTLKKLRSFFILISSVVIGFIPQLIAWQALYGSFLKSPYLSPYHFFDFTNPKLLEVLISSNNGLFFWTPLVALCLIGLLSSKHRWFSLLFILQWYLVASWSFWWQGASYSGRMFISLLPILAFGLATILSNQKRVVSIATVSGFSLLNITAIIYYLFTH